MEPEDATKSDKTLHLLNGRQAHAADLVAAGMNDTEVAEAVGAHRVTVNRWRHQAEFYEEVAARRREVFGPYVERLRSLLPLALATIEWEALKLDDLKLALRLVELSGLEKACRTDTDVPLPPINPPVATSEPGIRRLRDLTRNPRVQSVFPELCSDEDEQ